MIRECAEQLRARLGTFDPACWSGRDCMELAEDLALTAKACEAAMARLRRAAECQDAAGKDGRAGRWSGWPGWQGRRLVRRVLGVGDGAQGRGVPGDA